METNTEKRHYAVIDPFEGKITVKCNNQVLVESTNAVILKEVGKTVYNPVFYIPKEDINMDLLDKDPTKSSHCPIKGDATYWNLKDFKVEDYFAWSYEDASPRAKKINGFLAFHQKYVTFILEPLKSL